MPDYNGALHIRKSMAFLLFCASERTICTGGSECRNFTISLPGLNVIFDLASLNFY